MLENTKLNIVNDQKGSPVSSDFVAKVCNKLILKEKHKYNQIFHLSTKGNVSWYEIVLHLQNKIPFFKKCCKIFPINSNEFKSNVNRPKNSLLNHQKIENYLNINIPDWKTDIDPIIQKISKSRFDRKSYNNKKYQG